MAGKPEVSATPGVQNVVVYVSNDNFAQAYAVGQQNVAHGNQPSVHNAAYGNTPHSMATMVGPSKHYSDKQTLVKPSEYTSTGQLVNELHQPESYFTGVISQNGFSQPIINSITYQNGTIVSHVKNYSGGNNEVLSGERQAGPGRPDLKVREECDSQDTFVDSSYVTVMGAEGPPQSVRCDSVRSETAESSCSSLSSADEGMVVVQNQAPEMVVYDSSVSVRPGGVVFAVGPSAEVSQHQHGTGVPTVGTLPNNLQTSISVPYGWKRLLNSGSIIYISPSNTALSSPEQVKEYLLTTGTCKCGLECHFKYDNIFSFDPKVASKPWTLSPDTSTGDLTKLCNHKRKMITMTSLDCRPPDLNINKLRKDCHTKKAKRKMGMPYSGCVSLSQIFTRPDKLALNQHFNKESLGNQPQMWPQSPTSSSPLGNRLQNYQENQSLVRYQGQDHSGSRILSNSPLVVGDGTMMVQQTSAPNNISQQIHQNHQMSHANSQSSNVHVHQHIIGPNGQLISVQGPINSNQVASNASPINQIVNTSMFTTANNSVVIQGQNVVPTQSHQHRVFINSQPSEPSGPGRPNIQMIPVGVPNQPQRQDCQIRLPQHYYSNQPQYPQIHQYDTPKQVKPTFLPGINTHVMNGFRPQNMTNAPNNQIMQAPVMINSHQQRLQWPNRVQPNNISQQNQIAMAVQSSQSPNAYERVPPLHQHTPPPTLWQDDIKRKKVKLGKIVKSRPYHMMECHAVHAPCPNIDIRQIPGENGRSVIINHLPQSNPNASNPSFLEDPSGYLAQQTALLNNTINRQTGANACTGMVCSSPMTSAYNSQSHHATPIPNSQTNEVPLPSNVVISHMKQAQNVSNRTNQSLNIIKTQQVPHNIVMSQQYNQIVAHGAADSSVTNDHIQCQGCVSDSGQSLHLQSNKSVQGHSRPNSQPGTPSSSGVVDDPVTSSTYSDKHTNISSPDTRPIQGGTVSTSNVSPLDGSQSDPPTPNPHTPTPPQKTEALQLNSNGCFAVYNQHGHLQQISQSREACSAAHYGAQSKSEVCCSLPIHSNIITGSKLTNPYTCGVVTTMASGRTVGSNTITSVLAGRANTATVSINSPVGLPASTTPITIAGQGTSFVQAHPISMNVSKSPLEMVQSVVSSIQVPHSQHFSPIGSAGQPNPQISPSHIVKHSPPGLPPGHILVSSGGQLIMANTGNTQSGVMPPPPPKLVSNQQGAMPPISVSPMITNVTAAMSQVIPAVAQQVLGQQTVLVNALPTPFVLQSGVTMTMDGGMAVGQNMQLPQLVAGNVIQQQIQLDNSDPRRTSAALLSPENKKKGKKRKMSQTVANMLHIAAQQNPGVMMSQQGFPQQIQMAHSPQGLTGPVMQALTIVPSKTGGPPQLVMNGQPMANTNHIGTQQLITNSQPTQQINLLQPVNLINGTTGVVQNFPTIQQFIVPNLGGMVMNPDGTATILQDTSNIGMQLQLQNVNGQNVLTPVQNNGMFNGGQSILAASPAGMVIRAPSTSQGKLIQQQQHSPGAQFLSPNGGQFVVNGTQFSGQLSPLVASVSPSQVTFGTSTPQIRPSNSMQQPQQEYIQCGQMGQTLMVPCAPAANIAVSSSNQQNTTFVQQNTTIVQQQTTMVSNNQQLQNFQTNSQSNPSNVGRPTALNMDQNFIISANDNKQVQALLVQRESPQNSYRHSVSTQTAVNQNAQTVTTNTFCQTSTLSAGSPPDTTTHSPLAAGGQSPPTADTTTHSGSADDGLSPTPSNYSVNCDSAMGRQTSCAMAMVHCISSSEPDSADLNTQGVENDWSRSSINAQKTDPADVTSGQIHFSKKQTTPTHVAYVESSTLMTGLQFIGDQMKAQEAVVSSHNFDKVIQKRKSSDTLLVMETHHMHSSLFDDEEDNEKPEPKIAHSFDVGDLVWGPAKTCSAWPGKIIEVDGHDVSVKWFGSEKFVTKLDKGSLQTLTEGLDAHHHARKKYRTSRKLNSHLEKAIQEAMAELDKDLEQDVKETVKVQKASTKKNMNRLRSGHR